MERETLRFLTHLNWHSILASANLFSTYKFGDLLVLPSENSSSYGSIRLRVFLSPALRISSKLVSPNIMTDRQQQLLKLLVDLHVETAEPVSSQALVGLSGLVVSSATVRNDLSTLESEGYVIQPHTSAGRVPTEAGYRYYIESFVDTGVRALSKRRQLAREAQNERVEIALRKIAHSLSEITGEVVIVSSEPEQTYAVGMSRLFAQPEFHDMTLVMTLTDILDRFDAFSTPHFQNLADEIQIYVGDENPFGSHLAALMTSYHISGKRRGVFGILGPQRMAYGYNASLLREAQILINSL